jgi:hypothetical protein
MSFEEDFLAHYGKKGMKWGVRNAVKANKKRDDLNSAIKINPKTGKYKRIEARQLTLANRKADRLNKKQAVKMNPKNFKRDVKESRKGKGIRLAPGSELKFTSQTKLGLLDYTSTKGFVDSRNKKVGEDYAKAVLRKASTKNQRATNAKIGALYVGAGLLGYYGTTLLKNIR